MIVRVWVRIIFNSPVSGQETTAWEGMDVGWYVVNRESFRQSTINNQQSIAPLYPLPPPLGVVFLQQDTICHWWWRVDTIYRVWGMGEIVQVTYALGG